MITPFCLTDSALAQHGAHGDADRQHNVTLEPVSPNPLAVYRHVRTARQQPARKQQQPTTAVHTDTAQSVHNAAPLERSNDSRIDSSVN